MHSALGVLGVTGFLMKDLRANPLDYVEGGKLSARRQELSSMLDSTDPNLRPFAGRGGRMIVTIGTNDTLASPSAQLDYYKAPRGSRWLRQVLSHSPGRSQPGRFGVCDRRRRTTGREHTDCKRL